MENKRYGHFDDDNREYVITDPKTPWPWINYLGNDDFFSLISNTAGGYSFYKDAKFRRITRYRYNDVPMDNNGRYFYIKDGDTIWNPGWKPCKTPLDSYECRHGMNYTRIIGSKNGIEAIIITSGMKKRLVAQLPSSFKFDAEKRKVIVEVINKASDSNYFDYQLPHNKEYTIRELKEEYPVEQWRI